jgi:hypothetical protein
MEVKKYDLKGLEGKELELATNHNTLVEKLAELEGKSNEVTTIEFKSQIESLQAEILEVKNASGKQIIEVKSLEQQIVDQLNAKGINSVRELKSALEGGKSIDFEVKSVATANYTGDVARTNIDPNVAFTPLRKLALYGKTRQVAEDTGKDYFTYVEGTYTSNVAYVGEGTGNANGDSATATEETMKYGKIQAWQTVNEEVYEGLPAFANALVSQLQATALLKLDTEMLSGDGLAPAGVQHIKGLYSVYATEFDTTDYTASVAKANSSNLIEAMRTAIDNADGSYMADTIAVNPIDLFKMKMLKDNDGQPLVGKDLFGNPVIQGLTVISNRVVTANTCLVYDSNVVELRTKRSFKFSAGKIFANDNLNDTRSAMLIGRFQLLVRNLDKVAVLKCSDIASAVNVINIAGA